MLLNFICFHLSQALEPFLRLLRRIHGLLDLIQHFFQIEELLPVLFRRWRLERRDPIAQRFQHFGMVIGRLVGCRRRSAGCHGNSRSIAHVIIVILRQRLSILTAHSRHDPRKRHATRQVMLQRPPTKLLLLFLAHAIAIPSSSPDGASQTTHETIHLSFRFVHPIGCLGVHARQREVSIGHLPVVLAEAPSSQLEGEVVVVDARKDVVVGTLQVAEAGVNLGEIEEEGGLLGG
mmetsp:Transcript_25670/g.53591  ORF Transcript_25670/g.53591 Transcript_25670/m.53591 type:complete len:234 (+) Transcript_25670:422-1123(+)